VQIIDVVDHHRLTAVLVQPDLHPEGRGMAVDPARVVADERLDEPAFTEPRSAGEDQEVEMTSGEGFAVADEFVVPREDEGRTAWIYRLAHAWDLPAN
jgi:hypothetical protein